MFLVPTVASLTSLASLHSGHCIRQCRSKGNISGGGGGGHASAGSASR